jgi:hypothetical protein
MEYWKEGSGEVDIWESCERWWRRVGGEVCEFMLLRPGEVEELVKQYYMLSMTAST